MGCLKLAYYEAEPTLKVAYRNGIASEKGVQGWLSLDPLQKKYINLSPYNFVNNNPMIFIDPNGKEIRLAGNIQQGLIDIKGLVGERYSSKISLANDKVISDISLNDVITSNDYGVFVAFVLINSEQRYRYTVSSDIAKKQIDERGSSDGVLGMTHTSTKGSQASGFKTLVEKVKYVNSKGKTRKRSVERLVPITSFSKKEDGFDATLEIFDTDYEHKNDDGTVQTRESTVLHEFGEILDMQENGKNYKDSHDSTIEKEKSIPSNDKRYDKTPGDVKGTYKK